MNPYTWSLSPSDPEAVLDAVELVPATEGFFPTKSDGVGGFGPISPDYKLIRIICFYMPNFSAFT